jgi:Ni/Fe-hydrogenase subunit HybB-like protein
MWNGTSPLFEVGICVMTYVTVLYFEFIPIVTERFKGKVNLPGFWKTFNEPLDKFLHFLDRTFNKGMFILIIAGVVLSTLHQSSLGTLMVIAGEKMHPLWQTPILPLLFYISAICVGIPMIITESLIASNSFKLKPEMKALGNIATTVPLLLGIYLAFKVGDLVIRQQVHHIWHFDVESIAFLIEMFIGVIIPLVMLNSRRVIKSPLLLFIAAFMVVLGVLINRINNFIVAYHPPYATEAYIPSFGEIAVTLGCVALIVIFYRLIVMVFPVISVPKDYYKKQEVRP